MLPVAYSCGSFFIVRAAGVFLLSALWAHGVEALRLGMRWEALWAQARIGSSFVVLGSGNISRRPLRGWSLAPRPRFEAMGAGRSRLRALRGRSSVPIFSIPSPISKSQLFFLGSMPPTALRTISAVFASDMYGQNRPSRPFSLRTSLMLRLASRRRACDGKQLVLRRELSRAGPQPHGGEWLRPCG